MCRQISYQHIHSLSKSPEATPWHVTGKSLGITTSNDCTCIYHGYQGQHNIISMANDIFLYEIDV